LLKPPAHHSSLYIVAFTLALLQFLVGQRTAADSQPSAAADSAARAPARAKALKPPLYLEVLASLHGPTRTPFVPDVTLHPGAQISLQARTSSTAHVYMLHCDARATLSVFPDAGGIEFRADQWVALPAAGMPIKLGSEPGTETVYVIATRDALELADARLERTLTAGVAQPAATQCGAALDALLAGKNETSALPPTAATPPARKLPYAVRGVDVSKPASPVARAFAQDDGVVVLRFSYINAP
jgi:hypothetical protein